MRSNICINYHIIRFRKVITAFGHEGIAVSEQAEDTRFKENNHTVDWGILADESEHIRADFIIWAFNIAVGSQVIENQYAIGC